MPLVVEISNVEKTFENKRDFSKTKLNLKLDVVKFGFKEGNSVNEAND